MAVRLDYAGARAARQQADCEGARELGDRDCIDSVKDCYRGIVPRLRCNV